MRIAIIGIGNIGHRWLESIVSEKYDWEIYCVEAKKEIVGLLEKEFKNDMRVRCLNNIEDLPKDIDLCAITTTSNVRCVVFDSLINCCTVKNIVFEKVLFQKEEEYYHVSKILKEKGIKAWVNCTRREHASYKNLKEILKTSKTLNISVSGNEWGLGCNGIHIIDIIAYLSGVDAYKYDLVMDFSRLKGPVVDSKRVIYKELFGTINGRCGKCNSFQVSCNHSDIPSHIVLSINSDKGSYILDESAKIMFRLDDSTNNEWRREEFPLEYISQIMGRIINSIVSGDGSCLPSFEESMYIHLKFIKGINGFLRKEISWESDACPIT